MVVFRRLILGFFLVISFHSQSKKIALCIVATGRYIEFVEPLIESAEKYFCSDHEVFYVVFTDGNVPEKENIIEIYQERLGWPHDTLMRWPMYASQEELLNEMDYVFACDADMLFVNIVGDEILSNLVGTLHPGFAHVQRKDYENRRQSTAYIKPGDGKHYFCGGFNGGSSKEFLKMAKRIRRNIDIDLKKKIIARWHDESHVNRYYIDNPPTCILSPSYCYPGNKRNAQLWKLSKYTPKLMALEKNHKECRAK